MTATRIPLARLLPAITLLLSLSSLLAPVLAATKPKNAILLSDVQSLTLRSGAKTAHRRVPAAPQLKCISSPGICKLHEVDLMRCTNQGSGYSSEDIQWSCTASLPSTLKLGSTDVICEGYSSADDDYVLKGSCGVEYRLVLTEEGEERYPHLANKGGWGWASDKSRSKSAPGSSQSDELDWSGIIFIIIFVGVLAWMVYSACVNANGNNPNRTATRRPRNGGGGGGGGWGPGGGGGGFGGWGDDDPPPPYPGSNKPSSTSSRRQEGWRPGFFSGAAAGAAAGYYAGGRRNRQQQRDSYRNSGYGSGGSGWFGGGESSSSSSNNNHNNASTSGSRHESTGFGGTSRR